jgi:hypothetical protein
LAAAAVAVGAAGPAYGQVPAVPVGNYEPTDECRGKSTCVYSWGHAKWASASDGTELELRINGVTYDDNKTATMEYTLSGTVACATYWYTGEHLYQSVYEYGEIDDVPLEAGTWQFSLSGSDYNACLDVTSMSWSLHGELVTTSAKVVGAQAGCPTGYTHYRYGSGLSTATWQWHSSYVTPQTSFTGGDASIGREVMITQGVC